MSDTTLRQLKLLELLPRQPFKKSTQTLKENLSEIGFEVSKRTIQRDLKNLSSILPLISDERDKPYGWSWHKDAAGLNPSMDPIEALTFSLAQEYLEPLMPSKSFKRMNIFFERANNVLKEMDKSSIKRWRDNVRVVPQWQSLIPPDINEEVEAQIYDALLKGNQLDVHYLKRGNRKPEKRIVNPLGIVLQGVIHRLICTMDDSDNPRHLPIHRFKKAWPNGHKIKKLTKFDIDKFVEDQNIGYLISSKPINLEALFQPMAGFHLTETPISSDQKLTKTKEGNYLLKVELPDTSQLRWWLLGFGDQVEILKPYKLRQEFKEKFESLNKLYSNSIHE
ncbi:MAG: WYL domain-containing protein [Pseudomonadota bacterium]|nr:WYL domain-containing protein [Pseudomonadota bacterium]